MLDGNDLRDALTGEALQHLPLSGSPGGVYLLDGVDPAEVLPVWRAARALVSTTGRWPVAVTTDPYHLDVPADPADAVQRLRAAVDAVDPDQVFPAWVDDLPVTADDLHAVLRHRFPGRPDLAGRAIEALGEPTTEPAWDAWLYRELQADSSLRASVDVDHLRGTRQWHQPQAVSLALLPVDQGWLAPAFLSFHSCDMPEQAAALAARQRSWEEEFGAELVAHWSTMLQYTVARPPQGPDAAYRVAGEHKDIASSLQMHRYELALALPASDAWFLHDRP